MDKQKQYIVAITGASGAIYGIRLLRALLAKPVTVHLMISQAGKAVMTHETDFAHPNMAAFFNESQVTCHPKAELKEFPHGDLFAPAASGSFLHDGMVIAPCSMKTLAAVATGLAGDLIHRAADVCLKEKRPLILLTRETPLSQVHLENMARAARVGATILPPSPGFYFKPETILDLVDSIVARALDHLNVEHTLMKRWGDTDLV